MRRLVVLVSILALGSVAAGAAVRGSSETLPNPILFVTQVPVPADFATVGSVFANHMPTMCQAARGGDLWILYPDGSSRNLTAEAGYGNAGFQGDNAIAVRGPEVHWSGSKAVFSMVVGAPTERYLWEDYYWQLYEVSGLEMGESAVITRVANQPADANNVSPVYASDGRILFVSDRARDGSSHLYPQLDEYESTPTPTGLWSLDPQSGELFLLEHAPSGAFTPIVDSFGRVIFTRWDHLQRDQQADADAIDDAGYGSFDYANETAGAARLARREEVFPEPREARYDLLQGTNLEGHTLNHFFPWQIRQDGTGEEMVNHVGRHELVDYFNRALKGDPNLEEFIDDVSGRTNPRSIVNLLHIREDPSNPGRFIGTNAPEFGTHASGQIVQFDAAPSVNPDDMVIDYVTREATFDVVDEGATPPAGHSGHYRDPLVLSNGGVIAAHTSETRYAKNVGTREAPLSRYRFRLRWLEGAGGGYQAAGSVVTSGSSKSVSWWDPDVLVSYDGDLWELDPVEVVSRTAPQRESVTLAAPEQAMFDQAGVDPQLMAEWLRRRELALLVVRDATTRDGADRQQPFNLRVPGGVSTTGAGGTVYDIEHFQLYQGDQLRGYGGRNNPEPGRRVLARVLHDPGALALLPANPAGPSGSARIAEDGSVAAFVPTRRALAWQTTSGNGTPVVRERFWITYQPGEIRTCDGCHGVNRNSQSGGGAATNSPSALRELLEQWRVLLADDFESGTPDAWNQLVP